MLAHAAGFEAAHVNHLGLSGAPDWKLVDRIVSEEFTFVTNNRFDFVRLFSKLELHAGLIVLVPSVSPSMQRILFEGVLRHLAGRELINGVIEATLQDEEVACLEYDWPSG